MSKEIHGYIKVTDPVAFAMLEVVTLSELPEHSDIYAHICDNIISQQLSVKVATTIYKRFAALVNDDVRPENVFKLTKEQLRAVGLSWAKASYILDFTSKVLDGSLDLQALQTLKDEEVITELIKVKGIGTWTAEMILIFTLKRPDVFSAKDYGLKKSISKQYGIPMEELTEKKLLEISAKWSPHRSYVARALWKSLDNGL